MVDFCEEQIINRFVAEICSSFLSTAVPLQTMRPHCIPAPHFEAAFALQGRHRPLYHPQSARPTQHPPASTHAAADRARRRAGMDEGRCFD